MTSDSDDTVTLAMADLERLHQLVERAYIRMRRSETDDAAAAVGQASRHVSGLIEREKRRRLIAVRGTNDDVSSWSP